MNQEGGNYQALYLINRRFPEKNPICAGRLVMPHPDLFGVSYKTRMIYR